MHLEFPTLNQEAFNKSKKELINNGYTVLRNVIPVEFIKEIERDCVSLSWSKIGIAEINIITTLDRCTLSSSHNIANLSDVFKLLYLNKAIRIFYSNVIGEKANSNKMINSSYFFKSKDSKDIKLHQDNAYFNLYSGIDCLTFYIPVHYQDKHSGTIFYYRGSHKIGSLEHVPEGNLGASMCLKNGKRNRELMNYKLDYIELFPGDMVAHNALVVHGTLPNPKGKKCEAFNFTLFGENNRIDKQRYNKYQNMLESFLIDKNK